MPMEMNESSKTARKKAKFMVSLGMLFAFVGILLTWSAFVVGFIPAYGQNTAASMILALGGIGHILFGIMLSEISIIKSLLFKSKR